jgi:thiamine biosynthesis lipoprotein
MGSEVRLLVSDDEAAAACRAYLERFEAALSRFHSDSELCRLNAAATPEFEGSRLLCTVVEAGLVAAELTSGLFDPTLVPALEAAGYDRSRRAPELDLEQALQEAPPRRPARPANAAQWARVRVRGNTITRPPGVRIDSGGVGKGLAADVLALRLGHRERWAIDCGGDIRVNAPDGEPFEIHVQHPLTGEPIHRLALTKGAVATSGLDRRLWRAPEGTPRHHILDPSTGEPAWTGVIGATALAPTALEAETLAKAALLSGPAQASRWLTRHGGLLITDDGTAVVA